MEYAPEADASYKPKLVPVRSLLPEVMGPVKADGSL
jgi:hypothetical protein